MCIDYRDDRGHCVTTIDRTNIMVSRHKYGNISLCTDYRDDINQCISTIGRIIVLCQQDGQRSWCFYSRKYSDNCVLTIGRTQIICCYIKKEGHICVLKREMTEVIVFCEKKGQW